MDSEDISVTDKDSVHVQHVEGLGCHVQAQEGRKDRQKGRWKGGERDSDKVEREGGDGERGEGGERRK